MIGLLRRLKNSALYSDSWNVAFRQKPAGTILEDTESPFTVIGNSMWGWAADPFLVEHEGQLYVFAEIYSYAHRRGSLGYCKIVGGKATKWKTVIKEPYHLSYPCIFKKDGRIYMMPESGEGKELAIYEAVQFPDRWEKRRVLRTDIELADTTPLGVGTLALTHHVDDPYHPRLLLIDLAGEKADQCLEGEPFRSRPAGYPFAYDGQSVRPAQFSHDCSMGYGKALIFCRWQLEAETGFREEEIRFLQPEELRFDRNMTLIGMHTYNASAGYEIVDVKTKRLNLIDLFTRFTSRFK